MDQRAGLERFRTEVESRLPRLVEELVGCVPHRRGVDRAPSAPGIYLYSEPGREMYVGRTRDLSRRWADHTRPSSSINSASFAFNIAKREAAALGVNVAISRSRLVANSSFAAAFAAAKARVRTMKYRFVRVDSPVLSTVGEVYAAIVLGTEGDFNEFETH